MSPTSPQESRKLAFLSALFILSFFLLFSYSGLFAYFTFDDGTAVVANQDHFGTPMWRNVLHILTVFTTAYRPLATLFWRPLYALFGFNPLPYRIAVHLLLILNIGLAYVLSKRLQLTRSAALLVTLVFCYNASMPELYYDTCTVTDVICFTFYILSAAVYVLGRQSGAPLSVARIIGVGISYCLALDSKELAVALPGILTIYEALFHFRDFRNKEKALRVGGVLAGMFIVGAIYLKVKVADMAQNPAYHPHVTFGVVMSGFANYTRLLFYRPDHSLTPLMSFAIIGVLIALGLLLRSRQAVFGALFFVIALIPVAVIPPRGGYCAYIPYFGIALAIGSILGAARERIMERVKRPDLETKTAVAFFLFVALLLGIAHGVYWAPSNGYYEWSKPPVVSLMEDFRRTIPEFPPGVRILMADDPWGGDWGQMFLVNLMYHDKTVWLDRPKDMDHPPDLSTYDLVVTFKPPYVDLNPPVWFGIPVKWQIRGSSSNNGQFVATSPNAHGAASRIDFEPQAVRSRQTTTVTVPGLANVPINVLYRIVTANKSARHLEKNWCTLDAKGTCTITAPSANMLGALVIDWIQPANQHWIFTSGVLTIVP